MTMLFVRKKNFQFKVALVFVYLIYFIAIFYICDKSINIVFANNSSKINRQTKKSIRQIQKATKKITRGFDNAKKKMPPNSFPQGNQPNIAPQGNRWENYIDQNAMNQSRINAYNRSENEYNYQEEYPNYNNSYNYQNVPPEYNNEVMSSNSRVNYPNNIPNHNQHYYEQRIYNDRDYNARSNQGFYNDPGFQQNGPNNTNYYNNSGYKPGNSYNDINNHQNSNYGYNRIEQGYNNPPQNYNNPPQNNHFHYHNNNRDSNYYNYQENKNYREEVREIEREYHKTQENLNENNLDMNLDIFIGEFLDKSQRMGLRYKVDSRPNRVNGKLKDSAVLCLNIKRLCFSVIWEKGQDNINTIAMVTTGDGTQHSADETINTVRSFISTITPGLSPNRVSALIHKMGIMSDAEIGNIFVTKPNGRRIRYEHARSSRAGLVLIASPI